MIANSSAISSYTTRVRRITVKYTRGMTSSANKVEILLLANDVIPQLSIQAVTKKKVIELQRAIASELLCV
jgi:hypothetical protein